MACVPHGRLERLDRQFTESGDEIGGIEVHLWFPMFGY
jgi:hypothetical protein